MRVISGWSEMLIARLQQISVPVGGVLSQATKAAIYGSSVLIEYLIDQISWLAQATSVQRN